MDEVFSLLLHSTILPGNGLIHRLVKTEKLYI